MRCPRCQRPVRLFNFQRSSLAKRVVPRCGACRRYVLTWAHKLLLAAFALAAAFVFTLLLVSKLPGTRIKHGVGMRNGRAYGILKRFQKLGAAG